MFTKTLNHKNSSKKIKVENSSFAFRTLHRHCDDTIFNTAKNISNDQKWPNGQLRLTKGIGAKKLVEKITLQENFGFL